MHPGDVNVQWMDGNLGPDDEDVCNSLVDSSMVEGVLIAQEGGPLARPPLAPPRLLGRGEPLVSGTVVGRVA